MKAFKAFIKPFEALQKSAKINLSWFFSLSGTRTAVALETAMEAYCLQDYILETNISHFNEVNLSSNPTLKTMVLALLSFCYIYNLVKK